MNSGTSGTEEVGVGPHAKLLVGDPSPGDSRSRPTNDENQNVDNIDQKLKEDTLLHSTQLTMLMHMLRGGAAPETLEEQLGSLLTRAGCECRPAYPDMFNQLDVLKQALNQQFHSQGDLGFLNLAIQCQKKLIDWTPKQDEAYPGRLGTLGGFYASRFTRSADLADLHQAIEYEKLGVSLTRTNDPRESNRLGNLAMSYIWLHQATGRVEDIDNAIDNFKKVISLTPYEHPKFYGRLVNLGIAHQNRFTRLGQIDDINTAIKLQEQAVSSIPDCHASMVHCLINLGISYRCCYERTKEIKYADLAIHSHVKARSLTPPDAHNLPNVLSNLGSSYRARFRALGNVNDINKSIEFHKEAITIVSMRTSKVPPTHLESLGDSYFDRFARLGELQDLDEAMKLRSEAVAMSVESDLRITERLANLGITHSSRFRALGEVEDLEKATDYYLRAVSKTPQDHVDLPGRLSDLANAYETRFGRFGQMADLQKAINYHNQALSLLPEGDARRSNHLSGLASCHAERSTLTENLEDLERAIELQTQSEELASQSENDINLPFKRMNLAVVLTRRFDHLGRLCDIDRAIELQMHAMSSLPPDHPKVTSLLANLANSYRHRFSSLQQSYDIDRAIELSEQVLKLTPDRHSDRPERLYTLGITYSTRSGGQDNCHDLELAIAHISEAVTLTPNDHPQLAMRETSLGNSYAYRFEQLGQLEDADKALEHHSKALRLTPNNHANYAGFLNNIGLTHYYRYQQSGSNEDIDKAIEHQTHAVSLLKDDISLPSYYSNLAWSHLTRFQKLGDPKSLTSSLDYFKRSAQSFSGRPWRRMDDAHTWAQLIPAHLVDERLQAYQTAMDLIPELVWVGTSIRQRYNSIQQISSMALEAAAVAIQAQDYYLALQWLEQGRSVVWNQTLQLRTPLHDLDDVKPELAAKLRQVAKELYNSSSKSTTKITPDNQQAMEHFSQRQHRLAEEYKDLLDEVRRLSGFESFLKPKMGSELVRVARTGPVIVLNIHESRCDALVLVPGSRDITHIPLPPSSYQRMQEARVTIQYSLRQGDTKPRDCLRRPGDDEDDPEDEFELMLADLWTDVAKPIIDALGLKPADTTEKLSHITWCVTGPLSFLPLHAAGDYDYDGARLSDYAISSYTPTLSALFSTDRTLSGTGLSVLAVGQEATPGQKPLPKTTSELNHVEQHIKPPYTFTKITDQSATTGAVLDLMQTHDSIHLACHAHQNVQEPTESGIFLHDGRLSIAAITERRFEKKGLAFLSACQTATGDRKLVDESIHLAAAMLAAGYSSVVATMWSIEDADGPVITDKFYEQVMKNDQTKHRGTAEALYVAVEHLRNTVGEKSFQRWVPFVHFGM